MPGDRLDEALKQRLRAVLHEQGAATTESELRALAEQGRACSLILGGLIADANLKLERLSFDPASSLAEVAAHLRTLNELQPQHDELRELLAALDRLAHASRARWARA